MTGLQRFMRRFGWWVALRERMRPAPRPIAPPVPTAQDTDVEMFKLMLAFAFSVFLLLALSVLAMFAIASASPAHAQPVASDRIPANAARHKLTLKRESYRVWGLGAPVATFAAQVHQESRWRENAVSPVGAQGLAQFMPATASWISTVYREGEGSLIVPGQGAAPTNPTWALRALVTYDRWLWDRVKADDTCQRMAFVLSSYNGGLGWVYKRQARSKTPGQCLGAACTINPGIHPASQRENEHYPRLILQRFEPLYAHWGMGSCA